MGRRFEDSGYEEGHFTDGPQEDNRSDDGPGKPGFDDGPFAAEPKPASWDEMPVGPEPDENERLLALLAHLSIFVLGVIGPLVIWLIKKDESPFLEDQAKEALNFQLAVLIVSLVLGVTCIGLLVLPVVIVGSMIYAVLAALDANQGTYYRYPYTIRLIK